MTILRSRFEMAAVLTWIEAAGDEGLTRLEMWDQSSLGRSIDRAIYHLTKDGLIQKLEPGDRYIVAPDHHNKPLQVS